MLVCLLSELTFARRGSQRNTHNTGWSEHVMNSHTSSADFLWVKALQEGRGDICRDFDKTSGVTT